MECLLPVTVDTLVEFANQGVSEVLLCIMFVKAAMVNKVTLKMADKVITKPSTREYKEGWDRIFGGNIWKCPACGKEVDYGEYEPGRTVCSKTNKRVKMVKVRR